MRTLRQNRWQSPIAAVLVFLLLALVTVPLLHALAHAGCDHDVDHCSLCQYVLHGHAESPAPANPTFAIAMALPDEHLPALASFPPTEKCKVHAPRGPPSC